MLTLALFGLLALLLAGALFLLAAYLLPAGEQIAPPIRDEPLWDLPTGKRLDEDDVASVRLPVALRGYRFAETDLLLDRLAAELHARDAEIDRLRELRSPYHFAAEQSAASGSQSDEPVELSEVEPSKVELDKVELSKVDLSKEADGD